MKLRPRILIVLCITIFISSKTADAKTFAYLVGTDGKVAKMTTDVDSIVSTQSIPKSNGYIQSGETSVVADLVNNHLFAVVGRQDSKVLVYDLKTLSYVKDLGISTPEPDVTVFLTPDCKKVFVAWWNMNLAGGAWQFDVYDGASLEKIKTLDYYFYPKQVAFSKDSSVLYAIESGDNPKITLIDIASLSISSSIDLNTIWGTSSSTHDVEATQNEKILISETVKTKPSDPSKDTLYVYDMKNNTFSPRISAGVTGDEILSLDTTKIYLNEKQAVRSQGGNYVKYFQTIGRFDIYDVVSGKAMGTIPFSVDKDSSIIGIHPSGNKVYLIGNIRGNRSLIVLDVINLKMVKTLQISPNTSLMIFYNE